MSRVLIAYFSASGRTRKRAERISEVTGGDLFEIRPSVPYTISDLNWMSRKSRSSVEMNDPSSRPEMAERVANIEDYEVVFIGFPIWWYTAPSIIKTFLEAHDLSGKRIVLFATSGSSGLGKTAEALTPFLGKGARIVSEKLVNKLSVEAARDWADSILKDVDARLAELGIELETAPGPMANYVSCQRAGDLWFFSGAGPFAGDKPSVHGRLGENMTVEEGYAAARLTAINMLAILKRELDGDWDRLEQIVKINGYVSSTNDFYQQPAVINGVSDLLVEVLGSRGRHARTALGVNVLPFETPVEVEMVVKVKF